MVSSARHIEAMERVAALVDVRERCAKEVRERLERYGFDEEEVEDAVATALRVGLVDEERFARAFIRGKTHLGWGRAKIVARLGAAGIDSALVDACSDEFSTSEQELDHALAELRKRKARSSNPRASYIRRLVGKGYSYDIAKQAVSAYMDSVGES